MRQVHYWKALDSYFRSNLPHREQCHNAILDCFVRATDLESFDLARRHMNEHADPDIANLCSPLWGHNLDEAYLPMAIMNNNAFAVEAVKNVFGATIDDFGRRGSGGEEGLRLACNTPMLAVILKNYKPTIETRACVCAWYQSTYEPQISGYAETVELLVGDSPPDEFATHLRSIRSLWGLHSAPTAMKTALELFVPTQEVRATMYQRLVLDPHYGHWWADWPINARQAQTAKILKEGLSDAVLEAPRDTEARKHAIEEIAKVIMWGSWGEFARNTVTALAMNSNTPLPGPEILGSTDFDMKFAACKRAANRMLGTGQDKVQTFLEICVEHLKPKKAAPQ